MISRTSSTDNALRLKVKLATEIRRVLDDRRMSCRAAAHASGFAAADFSRVRYDGQLHRFTVDRLLKMLGALEPAANVVVSIERPATAPTKKKGRALG